MDIITKPQNSKDNAKILKINQKEQTEYQEGKRKQMPTKLDRQNDNEKK